MPGGFRSRPSCSEALNEAIVAVEVGVNVDAPLDGDPDRLRVVARLDVPDVGYLAVAEPRDGTVGSLRGVIVSGDLRLGI